MYLFCMANYYVNNTFSIKQKQTFSLWGRLSRDINGVALYSAVESSTLVSSDIRIAELRYLKMPVLLHTAAANKIIS